MKWHNLVANGYWPRYTFILAALLWLTLLALFFLQQDISCPGGQQQQPFSASGHIPPPPSNPSPYPISSPFSSFHFSDHRRPHPHVGAAMGCGHLRRELDQLRNELISLKEENQQLKRLAASRDFRPVDPGQFLIHKLPGDASGNENDVERGGALRKVDPLVVAAERRLDGQLYTKEHELARRDLLNGIWELFLRFNSKEIRQKLGSKLEESLDRQFIHLLVQSRTFALVDRAEEWHKRALDKVAERMRESLERLQNPPDCSQARLMVCELNKGCGFGCQLHHVAYCLIMAATSNRTLVLERDGKEWRYSEQGWNAAFQPITKCSWAKHVSSTGFVEPFRDLQQSARIVKLPIVDGLSARPPHLPLAFASQFADLLPVHHSNPPAFFIAQFLNFLMNQNGPTREFVRKVEKQIPFELGPIVGLQVRRTDKVGTEAAFHALEEYMGWAELWFNIEQKRMGIRLARRAFIATDDGAVIREARQKYGPKGWTIFGNDEAAEAAQPGSRYSDRSLLGVIADVRLLSKCSYIVCTFSSQVCRMGYELMQVEQGDAAEKVHSLDDIFYFGGQLAHELEAVDGFQPAEGSDQIELQKGDIIGIAGNHWNGWSKGTNRRTGQNGLFPSYLAREKWRTADFAIFEN